MGASYGGYMTNWIVTQTSRFKAATAGASIADLSDLYYLTDGGDLMAEYYKLPWENPEGYARSSPLTHAAKVTTPILISHGDRDPRVPLATAQKFFKRAAGARQDGGDGHLSARRPRLLRAAAGKDGDAAQLRLDASVLAPITCTEQGSTVPQFHGSRGFVLNAVTRFDRTPNVWNRGRTKPWNYGTVEPWNWFECGSSSAPRPASEWSPSVLAPSIAVAER